MYMDWLCEASLRLCTEAPHKSWNKLEATITPNVPWERGSSHVRKTSSEARKDMLGTTAQHEMWIGSEVMRHSWYRESESSRFEKKEENCKRAGPEVEDDLRMENEKLELDCRVREENCKA